MDTVVESKSVELKSVLNSKNVKSREKTRRIRKLVQVTSIVTLHLDENRYSDGSDIICQVDQNAGGGYHRETSSLSSAGTNTNFFNFSHTTQVKLELVTVPRVHRFELESGFNNRNLLQGDLLKFNCKAHSTPAVKKYRLFIGNRVISENADGHFYDIPAIKEFNSEILSCQAMNDEAGAGAKFELEKQLNVKCKYRTIKSAIV